MEWVVEVVVVGPMVWVLVMRTQHPWASMGLRLQCWGQEALVEPWTYAVVGLEQAVLAAQPGAVLDLGAASSVNEADPSQAWTWALRWLAVLALPVAWVDLALQAVEVVAGAVGVVGKCQWWWW